MDLVQSFMCKVWIQTMFSAIVYTTCYPNWEVTNSHFLLQILKIWKLGKWDNSLLQYFILIFLKTFLVFFCLTVILNKSCFGNFHIYACFAKDSHMIFLTLVKQIFRPKLIWKTFLVKPVSINYILKSLLEHLFYLKEK